MAKAAPLRRTSGITAHSSLNRQKTPYLLPDQLQRTPSTAGMKECKKGFLGLELETNDEAEEPLEMRPPREATVKLEKKTPGRKRRNLVEHSPFPDHLVPGLGLSIAERDGKDMQLEESTSVINRRIVRAVKVIPGGSLASRDTSMKAETDNLVVTPKKATVFKIPLVPAKPKKTPPIRPPPIRRSSSSKSAPVSNLTKHSAPEKTPKDSKIEDKAIIPSEDIGGPEVEENKFEFFEPDGTTRDVYVQRSKMIVKVKVEKALYRDGSPSEPSEEITAHIASTLQHFMVPFLHKLTFRHTGPMEAEYYVQDLPIMYHIQRKPHGAGREFARSRTETCWMWEDTVIVTPYLFQSSNEQ